MLTLSGHVAEEFGPIPPAQRVLLRLASPGGSLLAGTEAVLYDGRGEMGDGSGWIVGFPSHADVLRKNTDRPSIILPETFAYLQPGDVLRYDTGRGTVRVLFRTNASANFFLSTERCNHLCLMCSQPPRNVDDGWLGDEIIDVMKLVPTDTPMLGISGGEPTLLGQKFLDIVQTATQVLPSTSIHILSNGRAFADPEFSRKYAAVANRRISVGIPLYSSDPERHDYVVQARGAFDETVIGIMQLKALGAHVEIRVVVHQQTYQGLLALADFIFRNLTFVDHVTFMGLEITGFTRANLDTLWIDPYDYRQELKAAVLYLASAGMNVSVYNLPFCLIDQAIHPYAKQSISDWKNEYEDECESCSKKSVCAGFFSSKRFAKSQHVKAFT